MPDPGLVSEKVRAYMEGLSPAARAMLVRAARASVERGEAEGASHVVLKAVGATEIAPKAPDVAVSHGGRAWRDRLDELFLEPVLPFTVDFVGPTKTTGRIHRASVERVRTWLMRDVAAPDFAVAYAEDPGEDPARIQAAVRRLRRVVVTRAQDALNAAEDAPKGWQKLVSHLGGDQVVADLRDILTVFQRDQDFADLVASLPRQITSLDLDEPSNFLTAMHRSIDEVGLDIGFVSTAILSRTSYPHLLALLACRLAATSDPRAIAPGRYGRLVDALISDLERRAAQIDHDIDDRAARGDVFQALRDFHEIHRQMMFTLDVDDVSGWHRRVGAVRKAMSETIGRHVEAAAGLIRRALRVDTAGGSFSGKFDPETYNDADYAVRLFQEARLAADSLALNEVLARARREIERTLELITDKLLAELKTPGHPDRKHLIEAVDGSIRLCRLVFGEDYAAMMRKTRDLSQPAKTGSRATG